VHVEALRIVAVRPWDDVRCAQQCRIGNPRQRAAALPIVRDSNDFFYNGGLSANFQLP
jgi:hypothetical protein